MTNRIPHLSEIGDSKYTVIRDYDHIIASIDVAIDNIMKSYSLISEKNSSSLIHLGEMKDNYEKNLSILSGMRLEYLKDRHNLELELNKNEIYYD
jgi:hypothetical protein